MTNGDTRDLLHYHFSADEFYIMPVLVVATLIQFGIVFVTIWFAINLKARQLYHNTYKLLLAAVFLHVSPYFQMFESNFLQKVVMKSIINKSGPRRNMKH